jgi:OOP family OmpA-OmpF porin
MQADESSAPDSAHFATGPWRDGALPQATHEGVVTRQAWQIRAPGVTTLQLLRPLRAQLAEAGFETQFSCDTDACGGFDFRFALEVILPPHMRINLADFRYLVAANGPDQIELIVSRTPQVGFVQVTHVGPEGQDVAKADAPSLQNVPPTGDHFADRLETTGSAVLEGLTFATGSSQLGPGPFDALQDLADYLAATPGRRVALVGHTDAEGALEANIALSKRRAGSVLERLVSQYGVVRGQLDAQGMGYLAPRASNLTDEGRAANRRVEVIITSTAP